MDWRRAKSVLIFSFLMLNILLGYQLWMEWQGRLNTAVDWTSLPPETQQVMRDKNISIDPQIRIPTETPFMREITYEFKRNTGVDAAERIPLRPSPETRIIFYEDELKTSLGDVIPELNQYQFDSELSAYADLKAEGSESMFIFNRMEGGYPIFRSELQLRMYSSDQKIHAYTQNLIEIKPSAEAKEQQVLPATQAIANLIERNLPADSTIKEIRLGYQGQIFEDAEAQVSAPAWRVLLENGEVYYVNAISAEVATEKGDPVPHPKVSGE